MLQSEINEISDAFQDAWDEFFGQEMYYVPLDLEKTVVHPIYGETRKKEYDFDGKKRFVGTYKELSNKEAGELFGDATKAESEITFVTRELIVQGIDEVDDGAIIEITHLSGKVMLYNITEITRKVQFGSSRIFTKLGVVEIGEK